MAGVSLFKAFSILSNGPDFFIGAGCKWKSGLFNLTIGLSVAIPFVNTWHAHFYSGALPPDVPLIQSTGNFTGAYVNRYRSSREFEMSFHAADGQVYTLQSDAADSDSEVAAKANSGERFYVEGFILQNGKGLFWPTRVTSVNGRVLIDPKQQREKLGIKRSVFGGVIVEYSAIIPLWIVSLFNALKIKNRLAKVDWSDVR
ncbi:hypothetical protein bAD24_I00420 [Burkholderia sp. AD24]|nr:hypothetical protein bAD24_I00420 [Burkholderia sp. AD24]